MRDDIAEVVHKIIQTGIDLKERRQRGEDIDFEKAQADLLEGLNDPRLGEPGPEDLGARYALVCWLDEILIDDANPSAWGQQWSKGYSLEYKLYRTRLRAHKFWDPGVRRAEARPGSDALEVYYLCLMLGFRGDYVRREADQAEQDQGGFGEELEAWAERIRPQVIRSYGAEPPRLDNSTPENRVPLLTGREAFQTMLKWWGAVLLVLAFVAGFLVVKKIGGE
jgi:type VI secretion system protein ImpK